MKEFLESSGYHEYESEKFTKRVESESVCDLNGILKIFVHRHLIPAVDYESYTVSTIAEKKGLWFNIQAYAINKSELEKRLPEIESTLIKIFNAI